MGAILGRDGADRKSELRAAWRAWWAKNKHDWPPKEPEVEKDASAAARTGAG